MSAGPTRLEAAARTGTPAVVAPGCLDMANFWERASVPPRLQQHRLYEHNANVTLVRTTPEENVEIGERIAGKLNASVGPVVVYLPLRGLSVISAEGKPFHWPEADRALYDTLKKRLRADIPVREMDCAINDPAFADAMAGELLAMCAARTPSAR
jgi:uncharacterized protein (UPF0261 family)